MDIAFDTNVLVYSAAMGDDRRRDRANGLLSGSMAHRRVVPLQVLGEFYRVSVKKFRRPAADVVKDIESYQNAFSIAPTTEEAFGQALSLSQQHHLDIWDAVILAVAAEAGCGLLLTEDLQDGFIWRGLTVADPFAARPHPLLASIVDSA